MSIFISYSRQDQAYVNKLVQALKKQRLPVWLDDRIDYGDKWPRVIEENLRKCQVFLLVMSPHFRNSDWVNCELIKAKELQKPIFPLLLEGSRFLEVGNIQTVDVQGGRLPPANFFDRIRAKLGSKVNVPSPRNEVELKSEKGVNYTKLRDLLAAGKWKEADRETGKVMCQAAGRTSEGWLREDDIRSFPCEDLRTINQLWLHYSGGKFGFSVQKEIYESLGYTRVYRDYEWQKFGDRVGWKKGGEWLKYSDLTFNLELAPSAHLPALGCVGCELVELAPLERLVWGCGSFWLVVFEQGDSAYSFLAQRLVTCKI
ncbi:MAG: TIR domain-containing protein [Microcystis aeruginosa W13-11]|jgi:hypothetical protein|nr:TIR domain-containing protein [Microcystis aeruginosa W13-11]